MWKKIRGNRWVKFTFVSLCYIAMFVVWMRNPWMLFGEIIIFDLYISKLFHKHVWSKHKAQRKKSHSYKVAAEWVEAIIFATVVAMVIRIFIFEMYTIPTPSMEKTQLVGDYLCVSKVAYGPKMPNTPISFPLVHNTMPLSKTKKSYSEAIRRPYKRLAGRGSVQRGDVVVFNFPAGDTVLLENQSVTYYDVLREYQNLYGEREGREMLNRQYTVISRPVDKRENYVKRAVGIPGDTIRIIASELMVNGEPFPGIPQRQYVYYVYANGTPISSSAFDEMGISPDDRAYNSYSSIYSLPLTAANAERIRGMRNVLHVEQYMPDGTSLDIFPNDALYRWNQDNFGPLWVPAKGATVALTGETIPFYRKIINTYEKHTLEECDGVILIDGLPAESYTFAMNYYFMMGDNRHNSADSRFWGFVPEDHVVGKPSFTWLSLDKDKGLFQGKIRWNRMFRKIK